MSNSAMLVTRFLPERLKRNIAVGFDARWLELKRDLRTGYTPGKADPRMADLISDAKQAFALGLITYLPQWAKEDTTGEQQDGIRGGSSTHNPAPDNQRRAGRMGYYPYSERVRPNPEG